MPRFFVSNISSDFVELDKENSQHISKSLRMKKGEEITLCDMQGYDYKCTVEEFGENVLCKVLEKTKCLTEPSVNVTVYQAMPKMDKLELIVQKCVELGAVKIVPVLTSRCVSRPDEKSMKKKIERFQKISLEASKQSGRGIVPKIENMLNFKEAIDCMSEDDIGIILYEGGGENLADMNLSSKKNISIFIGSEGGFDASEVEYAVGKGIKRIGLGARILRCETAPIASMAIIMNLTKNM